MEDNSRVHLPFRPRESADGEGHKGHDVQGSRIGLHVHERLWHEKGGDGHHRQDKYLSLLWSQSLPSQVFRAGQRVV